MAQWLFIIVLTLVLGSTASQSTAVEDIMRDLATATVSSNITIPEPTSVQTRRTLLTTVLVTASDASKATTTVAKTTAIVVSTSTVRRSTQSSTIRLEAPSSKTSTAAGESTGNTSISKYLTITETPSLQLTGTSTATKTSTSNTPFGPTTTGIVTTTSMPLAYPVLLPCFDYCRMKFKQLLSKSGFVCDPFYCQKCQCQGSIVVEDGDAVQNITKELIATTVTGAGMVVIIFVLGIAFYFHRLKKKRGKEGYDVSLQLTASQQPCIETQDCTVWKDPKMRDCKIPMSGKETRPVPENDQERGSHEIVRVQSPGRAKLEQASGMAFINEFPAAWTIPGPKYEETPETPQRPFFG